MTGASGADEALAQACAAVGLAAGHAKPISRGENAIFRLSDGIIARVSRPGQQYAARREVAVSRWLNASGIPAVAALAHIPQPVEIAGRSVTFWEDLPAHRQGTPVEVAGVLKRLHALPVPDDVPLGALDPFVRLADRIDGAVTILDDDRAWLHARLAALQRRWAGLIPGLPACVVHGDAWAGNVVATSNRTMILLDLERCSIGPREWDLVSTAVKYVSFGLIDQGEYQQFCDAYSADVTAWGGFAVLRDIRELRMTCYMAQQAATHPRAGQETRLRIDSLRGRKGPRPWLWTPAD